MQKELKLEEIPNFVTEFLNKIEAYDDKATVVGLYGNLGAGKTTFTKEVAKQLEIKKDITSPTFTLQSSYDVSENKFNKLVHIDLYRIEGVEEVKILRLEELFKIPKILVLIEWFEKIEKEILKQVQDDTVVKVKIDYKDQDSRLVETIW